MTVKKNATLGSFAWEGNMRLAATVFVFAGVFAFASDRMQAQETATPEENVDAAEPPTLDAAIAAQPKIIRYTVAANSSISVTSDEIQDVLDAMTLLLATPDYLGGKNSNGSSFDADVACMGVSFARNGTGLVKSDAVPLSFKSDLAGSDWAAFRAAATANFYVVTSITCGTETNAIGCAPIGGGRERVVLAGEGMDGQVWVHEHGHTLGLNHTNTGACPFDYMQSQEGDYRRIMYCRATDVSNGVSRSECQKFGGIPLVLDDVAILPPAPPPVADTAAPAPTFVTQSGSGASSTTPGEIPARLQQVLNNPQDFETNRLSDVIATLNAAELDIVSAVIREAQPLEFLRGAVIVLGAIGDQQHADLLFAFLERQDVPHHSAIDVAKIAVLPEVGKIARRLGSQSLALRILEYREPAKAIAAVGVALASELQKAALEGVAEAGEIGLPILASLGNAEQARDSQSQVIDLAIMGPGLDRDVAAIVQNAPPITVDQFDYLRAIATSPQ